MLYNDLIVAEGDEIWAYRPIYNGSDEMYPVEKQIRPYIILRIYDDEILAAPLTSNTSHLYNYPLRNGTDVAVNDLYIIKSFDIIKRVRNFNIEIVDDIYECYKRSIQGNYALFPDITKQAFLEAYNERFQKISTVKEIKYYNIGDIIYLGDYPERKYIIDEVCDDKYYTYHVTKEDANDIFNYEFDFSSRVTLEKDECYRIAMHFSKAKYLGIKKRCLRILRQEIFNRKKQIIVPSAHTGSIVEFNGREYFVIFNTTENKYYCIPYNGNYQLDKIRIFNKKEVKYVREIHSDEVLIILEMVKKNIGILGNERVQNKIYMRILELK